MADAVAIKTSAYSNAFLIVINLLLLSPNLRYRLVLLTVKTIMATAVAVEKSRAIAIKIRFENSIVKAYTVSLAMKQINLNITIKKNNYMSSCHFY